MQTVAPASQFFSGAPPNLTLADGSELRTQFCRGPIPQPDRAILKTTAEFGDLALELPASSTRLASGFSTRQNGFRFAAAAASARRDVTDVRRFTLPMEAACV